jgi:lysosomal acid lipase/cholesteryl ester hydrolase
MLHGLLDTSEAFVLNDDDSIAFGFANLGYDVWLGNNRGGIYSKVHSIYNPHVRKPE